VGDAGGRRAPAPTKVSVNAPIISAKRRDAGFFGHARKI